MYAEIVGIEAAEVFTVLFRSFRNPHQLLPIKTAIALIIITITLPFIRAIMPTEKQAAAIILIPAVTQSERIKGVGDKTLDMLNGKLDQWLKDMAVDDKQKAKKEEKI